MKIPGLVAHRGESKHYPENTVPALRAALEAGALYVEFDVQICQGMTPGEDVTLSGGVTPGMDMVPMVVHDANLRRTTGVDRSIFDMTAAQLLQITVLEPPEAIPCDEVISSKGVMSSGIMVPSRLSAGKSAGIRLPTLQEVVELLRPWRHVTAFVEVKRASLARFGVTAVVAKIIDDLEPILDRCVIISFSQEVLPMARQLGATKVGWVFEPWYPQALGAARALSPDYLFCDYTTLPNTPDAMWPGPWQWVLYEINEPALALDWAARGADLIETSAIGAMLKHPKLRPPKLRPPKLRPLSYD